MISFIVILAQKDSMNESDDNMMTRAVVEIVIEEIVNLYVCKNLLLFKFLT